MSLVEKALRKLQDARPADSAPHADEIIGGVIAGSVSSTGRLRQDFGSAAPPSAPRNDKIISVDRLALRNAGLMPAEEQERRFANEYRRIKRPLITFAKESTAAKCNGRLIMLSSALPGEGKTFTSINLSMSIARERDISLLLVDADVAKPHISRTFGVDQEPGMLDFLSGESADVEPLVMRTNVQGLSILPAGRQSEMATELLASERMEKMAAMLINRHPNRIVIFDSSPLLLTSESAVLANIVGQIVLVVRAEATAPSAVQQAIAALGTNWETKNVGLVLNQSTAASAATYYGYGDYYDSAPEK